MVNDEVKPNPDPTTATVDAVERGDRAERDYVNGRIEVIETRLDASDEAVKVLSGNVNRTPTLLQTAIKSFGTLVAEKFRGVDRRLAAAEKLRLEQKVDSKVGLDAALAAQKEAAGTQADNFQKAIDKSEKNTADLIKTNQESNKASIDKITKDQDELKIAVTNILATKAGGQESKLENQASSRNTGMWIGVVVGIVGTIFGMAGLIITIIKLSHP